MPLLMQTTKRERLHTSDSLINNLNYNCFTNCNRATVGFEKRSLEKIK